ncbi:MAG: DNA methyltransferase [bacterium]
METEHKIIIGDSRDMSELKDESVHLVVTSPPYWQLKDYGNGSQIGFDDSYEDYINNLNLVWNECYRILHKGCRLCVNIGDQFARSVYYGRYKVIPIRTEIIRFCETVGFDYMGAIIWQKVTTTNTTGGATVMGSFPYPRNGILKLDYEFILIFKKLGIPPKVSKATKEKSIITKEEWNQYFTGHWNFSGTKQDKHLAMFPEELPKRLIKMFTFVGDTVLDPFLGSGTTSLAALNQKRNSIGYEVNPDFREVIEEKLGLKQENIFNNATFKISTCKQTSLSHKSIKEVLPYIFTDPIKFNKKVDPKKLQFGSKIDNNSQKRDNYYCVERVIAPDLIELNSGVRIKLIGVKPITEKSPEAIDYLKLKTKGQKVYVRYDKNKYDDYDNLLVYLYLKNNTFINAHLIKQGFVKSDKTSEYKYKNKFINLENTKEVFP